MKKTWILVVGLSQGVQEEINASKFSPGVFKG